MATTTNVSNNKVSYVDLAFKGTQNVSSRSDAELYKTDSYKNTSKSEDFKAVLNSKSTNKESEVNSEVSDSNISDVSTKISDTDEIKEKLEELEDESKSDSKDKVSDILTELLNLLAKFGIKEEDLKLNEGINSDTLKNILEGVNNQNTSSNNVNAVMDKILELLKTDSVKDALDTDSLKTMEKMLGNLGASLADDNTDGTKEIKNGIKNLMSEISNVLQNKHESSSKVLTLEDMLNKNYSQDSSENSSDNKNNNGVSKEDKFLNSLVDDKDDSSNKINLFASRNSVIQNQAVNTVRGLTVNKTTFVDDLIKDVKFMNSNSLKELTVKVNPGDLGEITIKLIQEDGIMKANLKANSKETTALLSQNLSEIKKQLGEQNIKIEDVNIELYQGDTTFFKEQSFGGQLSEEQGKNDARTNNSESNLTIDQEELIDNIATNDNNIEFFA